MTLHAEGLSGRRKMLEQSTAALCPSVAYHLTGAKKVQQDLASGDTLERFLSADEAKLVRRCFAGMLLRFQCCTLVLV